MTNSPIARQRAHLPARAACAVLAVMSAGLALVLAAYYPLGSGAALLGVAALAAVMFWRPWLWLVLVPGLLPLIGWAPWTGWLTFEELDMLLLAACSAGYGRLAYMPFVPVAPDKKAASATTFSWLGWLLVGLFGVSTLWALARGLADAGGFTFGWFQGYLESMNSVRLAKSFFLALLLWPLWRAASSDCHAERRSGIHSVGGASATVLFALGMTLGLAGVSLTTIWERLAFTGLLNFASEYRTTGMFWEMHVGGAALDGYLALTIPFAVQLLLLTRRPWQWAGAGLAVGLGLYACLTTFSRGVFLALPVGVAVTLLLYYRQHSRLLTLQPVGDQAHLAQARALRVGAVVVGLYACAAAWIFPSSGYRGAFALMGVVVALLALAHQLRRVQLATWVGGALLAIVLSLALLGAYSFAGKSSYAGFGLGFLGCMGAVWAGQKRSSRVAALGLGCLGGVVLSAALVFDHWGGDAALWQGLPVLGLLLLVLVPVGLARTPLWPHSLRWHGLVALGMLMVLTMVAVFTGGGYISERFSTGREDLGGRLQHWQQGIGMLGEGAPSWLGKGMGRYPATYYMDGPRNERVGDYRLVNDENGAHLVLSGGLHSLRGGSLLRLSQRVDKPQGKVVLSADVKAAKDVRLEFEVCPKHLLFTDYSCLNGEFYVKGAPDEWQHLTLPMKGGALSRGDWYAPKLLVFSISVTTNGGVVAVDKLHLRDASGTELLENPDFSRGMSHWFMSSDRNHMPWHIKSMPLNVAFDQGALGLMLFGGLTVLALWRLSLGASRNHTLAPALAGAIVGFWVVGLFDSLLDVPRVAFLFYFLLLVALTQHHPQSPQTNTRPE